MIGLHLVFVFGLSFLLFPCKGKIISPADGTNFTLLPGSNKNITWKFVANSAVETRIWSFTSSAGAGEATLASITATFNPQVLPGILPEFKIIKPATLELSNVNQSYDGTYSFKLKIKGQPDDQSDVRVYIVVTPIVTVNCSRVTTMNKGDYVVCECKGTGGNPPADVTWFKGNTALVTGKEKAILHLPNVNKEDNGRYRCEAKSHEERKNITEFELNVHFPPENTILNYEDKSLTITCDAEANPSPTFEIYVNETELVKSDKTYTIPARNNSFAGNYTCVAVHTLGRISSLPKYISFGGTTPPTSKTSTPKSKSNTTPTTTGKDKTTDDDDDDGGTNIGLIVGIIIGVLVFLLIIGVVVYCYKSKEKDGRNRANIDPVPGNHYELENEEPVPGDGAYDTVGPVGASGSKSKPPAGNTLPPVYAAVDKNNRQGNTLYASLDTDAMQSSRASKKEPDRPPQTEYASIDFKKSAPKADLV